VELDLFESDFPAPDLLESDLFESDLDTSALLESDLVEDSEEFDPEGFEVAAMAAAAASRLSFR
jgi:hypothetical protein